MINLDIVIVNKNAGSLLLRCLDSIGNSSFTHICLNKIVLVDNASNDASQSQAAHFFGEQLPLVVLQNEENFGFAKACNQGAEICDSEFILFLNPDICLEKHTIELCATRLAKLKPVAIAGICLQNEDGSIQNSKMNFPTPKTMIFRSLGLNRIFPKTFKTHFRQDQDITGFCDCVLGAFFLCKKKYFSGFDFSFFLYYEEIDFAKRLCSLGLHCLYFSDIKAIHTGGVCSNKSPKALEYSIRSKLLYARRYFSFSSYVCVFIATYSFEILMRSLDAVFCFKNPFKIIFAFINALKRC